MANSAVCISRGQQTIHIIGEVLALVAAPLLAYAAFKSPRLSKNERILVGSVAVGSVIIDGYLLTKWMSR